MSKAPRVVLYDPDGVNPYGRELGLVLHELAISVEVLTAQDAGWMPTEIEVRGILPANRSRPGRLRQLAALVRGLVATTRALLGHAGCICVVVGTRSSLDEAVLAVLAVLTGRVILIVHNPVPRTTSGPLRQRTRWLLHNRASRLVAHSEELARVTEARVRGQGVCVAVHPPYAGWGRWANITRRERHGDDPLRVLLLGQIRPDKGFDNLMSVLGELPRSSCERLEISFCGAGALSPSALAHLTSSGATVMRLPSDRVVPDEEVASALADSDVLAAPYRDASQSGSVILARTAGLPVLAFAVGALPDVVPAQCLVPDSDVGEFARKLQVLIDLPQAPTSPADIAAWTRRCAEDWAAILRSVGRAPIAVGRDD